MSQEAVDYLLTEIRPTLVAEVVDVALELGSEDAHRADLGHFSVPRDVFAYVDHLGQIAYGGRSTKRSVRFLREFFPLRYDGVADLLYAMWRHGVVHSYEPISYSVPLGDREVAVYWVSTNHASDAVRQHHLLPYAIEGLDDVVALVVNTCQLACDLRDALDTFIERLRGNPEWAASCAERIRRIRAVHPYTEVHGDARDLVREQVVAAWRARGGILDGAAGVKSPHPAISDRGNC